MDATSEMSASQVEAAIRKNGEFWRSNNSYIEEEIGLAKRHPYAVKIRTSTSGQILAWVDRDAIKSK